jgi:signal transduction histidine kinase
MLAEMLLSLNALTTVPLTGEATDLGPRIVWVEDRQGNMSLEEFSQAIARGEYKSSQNSAPNLGYMHHPVYFVVPIENQSDHQRFILNITYPLLDEITLHVLSDKVVQEPLTSGDHVPFSQRYRPYRTINFKVDLPVSGKAYLVFRVKSESSMQLQMKIHSESNFGDMAARESLVLGLYYGLNLVMIIYNTFLYFSLRMRGYLFYVGYLAIYLLFQANLHGVVFQFLFPNYPGLNDKMVWVWGSIGFVFAFLFALHFHELDERLPRTARAARAMIWAHIVFLGLSFVMPYYIISWVGTFLVSVVNSLMMVGIGLISLRHGYRPARYFTVGWSILVIGNFIYGLKSLTLLPSHFLIDHGMLICSSIEVVLLSLALGDRVNLLQQERDEANRALIDGYSRLQVEIDRREELEKQKLALGQEIRQATEQLIQADKMSTMGQLVAGVAHDIANPTQLIINSKAEALKTVTTIEERLNALLEGDDPEVVSVRTTFTGDLTLTRSSLHDISTAVDRIEAIQSAIRNQTRLDTKPSVVQLRPLIDECLTILRSKLKPFHVEVECPEELMLECRRSQLGQVITNLLSNAADALMEKVPERNQGRSAPHLLVRVLTETTASGESVVTIEIEDDGPGISPDKKEKIFTPFFTTKAVGVGTGLGLSICQKIITAHGGSISVQNPRRLQGACFHIEIPTVALKEVA